MGILYMCEYSPWSYEIINIKNQIDSSTFYGITFIVSEVFLDNSRFIEEFIKIVLSEVPNIFSIFV